MVGAFVWVFFISFAEGFMAYIFVIQSKDIHGLQRIKEGFIGLSRIVG